MHALESAWESLQREFHSACQTAAREARADVIHGLNQVFRRLRAYDTEAQWIAALRDGAALFSDAFGIFTYSSGTFQLRADVNLSLPDDLTFDLLSAHAFAATIESREPTVSLRRVTEVGPALSGSDAEARAHLFPVSNAGRVVAVLFAADSPGFDANALELVAEMGAAALERHSNQALHAHIAPATLPAVVPSNKESAAEGDGRNSVHPPWASLEGRHRDLHIRAQRFSRVAVAQMELSRPEACRAGREQSDVYLFLQGELDKARSTFQKQFMTIPSMVDYLHLELVKRLAGGDETKLGADYPGQLV